MNKRIGIVAVVCLLSGLRVASARPGNIELRLTPVTSGSNFGITDAGGLRVIAPERGGTLTQFGLGLGLGFLVTRHIEPGFATNLAILSGGGNSITVFGMVPFLKINSWLHPRFNPFLEPFAGFALVSNGGTSGAFDGGIFLGGELLFGNWGVRLHTGFEVVKGSSHAFVIPFGWSLIGYI